MDHRKYLKPLKAAEKIGVTVATMANWRWQQKGPPFYRVRGLILYCEEEIDGWITAGRQSTTDAVTVSTGLPTTPNIGDMAHATKDSAPGRFKPEAGGSMVGSERRLATQRPAR
jgi:hypothetical protein